MTIALVEAGGGPRCIGRAQGQQLEDAIARSIALYERWPGDEFGAAARRYGAWADSARAHVPDLVEELEGMAEGARASSEALWVLSCFEELWPAEACTSILSGTFLIHAEQWYAGHSDVAVVHARPEGGPAFLSPTCAGFLPAVGLNASGFAQGVDSLSDEGDRAGVPRTFVARLVLGAPDLDGAIEAAALAGRAGGYAHAFSSRSRRVIAETTATSISIIEDAVAHTNHYLAAPERGSPGSRARLGRALELVAHRPPDSLEDCVGLLSDHASSPESICLHSQDPYGTATVFGMACNVVTGEMLVSEGPPCEGKWSEFHIGVEPARVG